MTKAVRVHKVGGPEALVYESVDVPAPRTGRGSHPPACRWPEFHRRLLSAPASTRRRACRSSPATKPPAKSSPSGPASPISILGDRVAYYFTLGGYATERNIPADKLVKLPDHITYEQGAVLMLKGLTVWYLLHKTFKVEPHHRVLIHAAAGGIGLLACQWARALGAHVIGTVGSKAKADLALANGCDHVILYNEEDFVARVKQISRKRTLRRRL